MVKMRRMSRSESEKWIADRKAAAWPDNPEFCSKIKSMVQDEVVRLTPAILASVREAHETFGLQDIQYPVNQNDGGETIKNLRKIYWDYDDFKLNREYKTDVLAIKHPSVTIPDSIRSELTVRGFHWNALGWFDACGEEIRSSTWVSHNPVYGDNGEFLGVECVDPVGITNIYAEFDALHKKLQQELGVNF